MRSLITADKPVTTHRERIGRRIESLDDNDIDRLIRITAVQDDRK